MKKQLVTLLGVAAVAAPLLSQAAIVSGYGVEASTSTSSYCPSYCSGDFQYDQAGTEFDTSATASQNSYASADASSSLSGASYLPTLKVKTAAGDGKGGFATAFGVQGYTYTGTDVFEFTLNYNLHGSTGANPTGSINNNKLRADVAILVGGGDLEWYPDFATLVYEVASGFEQPGVESLFLKSGDNQNAFGSISFLLNPGDEFYVVGSVEARSIDGYADGWNTFSMNFQDDTGLVAVSAVPVPAAVWLFASGLIGLAGVARAKKS